MRLSEFKAGAILVDGDGKVYLSFNDTVIKQCKGIK